MTTRRGQTHGSARQGAVTFAVHDRKNGQEVTAPMGNTSR